MRVQLAVIDADAIAHEAVKVAAQLLDAGCFDDVLDDAIPVANELRNVRFGQQSQSHSFVLLLFFER